MEPKRRVSEKLKNKPAINKQTRPIETIKSKSAADNDDDYDRPIKRKRKTLSCAPCRKRKIKCDHKRPCGQCILRELQSQCEYEKSNRWGYSSGPDPASSQSYDQSSGTQKPLIDTFQEDTFSAMIPSSYKLAELQLPQDQLSLSMYQHVDQSNQNNVKELGENLSLDDISRNTFIAYQNKSNKRPWLALDEDSVTNNLNHSNTNINNEDASVNNNVLQNYDIQQDVYHRFNELNHSNIPFKDFPNDLLQKPFIKPTSTVPVSSDNVTQSPPSLMSLQDTSFLISEVERCASTMLPISNWSAIYRTLKAWNRRDATVPPGNTNGDLIVFLITLYIGYQLTESRKYNILNNNIPESEIFSPQKKPLVQAWLQNLIGRCAQTLYFKYPTTFSEIHDITPYLLHSFYLCHNESPDVSSSWSKISMFTSTFQRLGYSFPRYLFSSSDTGESIKSLNKQIQCEQQTERWIEAYKTTEKLIAYSMRTQSLINTSLFPHLTMSTKSFIAPTEKPKHGKHFDPDAEMMRNTWSANIRKSSVASSPGSVISSPGSNASGGSTCSSSIYAHLMHGKLTFHSIRLALFEVIDSVLQTIYSSRHLVHPKNLTRYEGVANKLAKEFVEVVSVDFEEKGRKDAMYKSQIRYQLLAIQSLCNTIVMLIYRPYTITEHDPLVASEIFRRKGAAAAIGAISSMMQLLEYDFEDDEANGVHDTQEGLDLSPSKNKSLSTRPSSSHDKETPTYETYKWFAWVDIFMAAFEGSVLLALDHRSRQQLEIPPDKNHIIKQFGICLLSEFKEKKPRESLATLSNSGQGHTPGTPGFEQSPLSGFFSDTHSLSFPFLSPGTSINSNPSKPSHQPYSFEPLHSNSSHSAIKESVSSPIPKYTGELKFPGSNCWSTTDTNWRVNLVTRVRDHFLKIASNLSTLPKAANQQDGNNRMNPDAEIDTARELSRPYKAATILTALLDNADGTTFKVPKRYGPFSIPANPGSTSSSKGHPNNGTGDESYAHVKFDVDYFESLVSEPDISFWQRLAAAVNDTIDS